MVLFRFVSAWHLKLPCEQPSNTLSCQLLLHKCIDVLIIVFILHYKTSIPGEALVSRSIVRSFSSLYLYWRKQCRLFVHYINTFVAKSHMNFTRGIHLLEVNMLMAS
jgi:hypothetical protein